MSTYTGQSLKAAHINVQSIKEKECLQEISNTVKRYDVCALTETWLKRTSPSAKYEISGYRMFRSDRDSGKIGGGILVHVKEELKAWTIDLPRQELQDIEFICIGIEVNKEIVKVCSVYIPPKTSKKWFKYEKLLECLFQNEDFKVICLGDFNIDIRDGKNKTRYDKLMKQTNTKQLINEPTRITEKSETTVDHVIVHTQTKICSSGTEQAPFMTDKKGRRPMTDHELIYVNINL